MSAQPERIETDIEILAESALALVAGGIVAMAMVGAELKTTFSSVSSSLAG